LGLRVQGLYQPQQAPEARSQAQAAATAGAIDRAKLPSRLLLVPRRDFGVLPERVGLRLEGVYQAALSSG
jgi:hypothetical protein